VGAALFELAGDAGATRFRWTPSPLLFTPRSTLQGGAGLGAAVAAMERATGRPAVWATGQYLSFAVGVAPVELDVTIEVAGHNTTQARCVVSRDGGEILTTHAALGSRSFDDNDVWCVRPAVPEPADCPAYPFFRRGEGHMGDLAEFRLARGTQFAEVANDGRRGDGSFALWVRCWDDGAHAVTVPDLAFIGDFMPLAFAGAMGKPYSGNSLDNTIRVGNLTRTGWVLLSCHVDQVANGFGHGRADMWAQDGTMLGTVSQTSVLRPVDKLV
jgi:acyl-CoA thioesterase-2